MWVIIPATIPAIVWERMALLVSFLELRVSIIAMWVERYPLHVMPIVVKTAISFAVSIFSLIKLGMSPKAAPVDPSDVSGKAISFGDLNPNIISKSHDILLPRY